MAQGIRAQYASVKARIKDMGLAQKQISYALNFSRSSLSGWLNGKATMSPDRIREVLEYLDKMEKETND